MPKILEWRCFTSGNLLCSAGFVVNQLKGNKFNVTFSAVLLNIFHSNYCDSFRADTLLSIIGLLVYGSQRLDYNTCTYVQ